MGLFTASNEAELLSYLTAALAADGVKLVIQMGADEDARRSGPRRITFVPRKGGRRYSDPAQQLNPLIKVGCEKAPAFDVRCWGRDYLDATRLEDSLIRVLYNSLSRNAYELSDGGPADAPEVPNEQQGYELSDGGPADAPEGPNEQSGYELTFGVRFLKVPVAVENYTRTTLETLTAQGAVSGALGETPTSTGPTITITES